MHRTGCEERCAHAAAAKAPSTASSMNTHAKHSYVPATPKLKAAALTGKDKLPVLRSTGSYTPSSRCAGVCGLHV